MFCRHCGEDNKDHHNYCSKDGALLYKNNQKVNLTKTKAKFCKECGEATESHDIYCSKCGISLFEKRKKDAFMGIPDIKETINFTDNKTRKESLNLKTSLTYGIVGFGIVFLLSIMISSFINLTIKDELMRTLGFPMDIKLLKIWDLALLFNATSMKFIVSSAGYGGMSGTAGISGAPLIFLLVPFIIFFALGIHKGKTKNKLGGGFDLIGTLIMGLSYGLILTVISLIASIKMNVFLPGMGEVILQKKYLLINALINGTIISIISFMIGYAVYWKVSKNNNLVRGFEWLFEGLLIFLTIAVSICLITGFYMYFIAKEGSNNLFLDFITISQMGIYAFLMVNFGSFIFADGYSREGISIFKNTDTIKNIFSGSAVIFLYIGVLLVIVLFYLYGKRSKERGNKNIIYTTIGYSLVVGILAYLTYLNINGYGSSQAYMGMFDDIFAENIGIGFKFLYSIIGSFILSTCSMFAGFFLSKEGKSKVRSY